MSMRRILLAAAVALSAAALPAGAQAHCDGLDGPVVSAARTALASGDVNAVLIWVRPQDEDEIRSVFQAARAVRTLSPQAQELADRHFFETLVRLHRAGEGAPYNGLQPAGRDLGPAIRAADRAVETHSPREVAALLTSGLQDGIRDRFAELERLRRFSPSDLASGRAYVGRYVSFVHYVEALHRSIAGEADGHYPEPPAATGRPERHHEE